MSCSTSDYRAVPIRHAPKTPGRIRQLEEEEEEEQVEEEEGPADPEEACALRTSRIACKSIQTPPISW